ncbi:MAG: glutamine-hydrolyzing carbamoyl-phosphate synthase small subunit [Vampirovibrionales bacterium]
MMTQHPPTARPAWLVLENGLCYEGTSMGATGTSFGELVFNTAMTGYQEILSDPSYKGQVVLMTYPEIGNYGVNTEDMESTAVHASGFVVRELSSVSSNWRACGSLEQWLQHWNVVGIAGVDTRELTRQIRTLGSMKCGITTDADRLPQLHAEVTAQPILDEQDLVFEVTTPQPYTLHGTLPVESEATYALDRMVVLDFGIKQNILRCFQQRVKELIVLPATATYTEVMSHQPQAVFLSNGPGDPRRLSGMVQTLKRLMDHRVPLLGICLGHQLLSLAMGLPVEKMEFGHHGGNHPVKDTETGRISITSQNHGYCVQATDPHVMQEVDITHVNLNDNTVEGVRHKHLPIFCVQFHPEAAPGPHDAFYLFDTFLATVQAWEAKNITELQAV